MANNNRFQKGSGCYTCASCGKRTRDTGGGDAVHVRMCEACYDYAGWENTHSDMGHGVAVDNDPNCPICQGEPAPWDKAEKPRFADDPAAEAAALRLEIAVLRRKNLATIEERNTVLAALRWYQYSGMADPGNRPDWLQDIACPGPDGGCDTTSLCDEGIDELCERLNS